MREHSGEPTDESTSEPAATETTSEPAVIQAAASPSAVNTPALPEPLAFVDRPTFPDLSPAAPLLAARPLIPVSGLAAPRAPKRGATREVVQRQGWCDVPSSQVQRARTRVAPGSAPQAPAFPLSTHDEAQAGEHTARQPLPVSPLQRAELVIASPPATVLQRAESMSPARRSPMPSPPTPRLPLATPMPHRSTSTALADPVTAALSTGLARVDADGAISFPGLADATPEDGRELPVQRATSGSLPAPAPPLALQAVADAAPGSDVTPASSAAASAAPAATGTADLDELAKRLYDRIRVRLKAELRLDRERAGLITELGR